MRTGTHPTSDGLETTGSPVAGATAAPAVSPRRPMPVTLLAALVVLVFAAVAGALVLWLGSSESGSTVPAESGSTVPVESGYTGDWKDTFPPPGPGGTSTTGRTVPANEAGTTWTGDWKDSYVAPGSGGDAG